MQIRFWRSVLYSSLEVLLKPLWIFFFLSSKPMSFAAGNLLNQQSFFFSFLSLFFFFASYLFSLQSMLQQIRLHWSKDLCCCLWWWFFFPLKNSKFKSVSRSLIAVHLCLAACILAGLPHVRCTPLSVQNYTVAGSSPTTTFEGKFITPVISVLLILKSRWSIIPGVPFPCCNVIFFRWYMIYSETN